ncbi:unnamed protein product, partial [Mesorhabditis spiculigera]
MGFRSLAVLLAVFGLSRGLTCPGGTQLFNGYCYEFTTSKTLDQQTANQQCASESTFQSSLASIMNAFENLYLTQNMPAGTKAWIGGKYDGSKYSWTDGLPFTYNNVNNSTTGGCLLIDKDTGKWFKADCSEKHAYICKLAETAPFVVSNSTGSKAAAAYILRGIDPTVNPCEDFYGFTCNTYIKNAKLHGGDEVSVYDEAQTAVNQAIAAALDNVNSGSSLTEKITKKAYDACQKFYDSRSPPVYAKQLHQEFLTRFNLTQLPLFQSINASFSMPNQALWKGIGYFEGSHAVGTLINSYATVDYKNITSNALFMDQPALPLPRDYYVKPQFLTIMEDHVDEYVQLIRLFAAASGQSITKAIAQEVAADVVNFEIAIALASWPDEEMRNYQQMYNPYKLAQLKSTYPGVEWESYFDNLFYPLNMSSRAMVDDSAIVGEPSYFGWLASLFSGNLYKQSTILNYITVQVISDSYDFLGDSFSAWAKEHDRVRYIRRRGRGLARIGARNTPKKFDSNGDYCVDLIMDYMPYGPGYVYGKQLDPKARAAVLGDVSDQTGRIISSFKDMIGTLTWMPSASKSNAYTKAANLIQNVGFPKMFGDFSNAQALDTYHQDYAAITTYADTDFYDIMLTLKTAIQSREAWRLLNEPADRSNFLESPAEVNAWYQPERNSITFPYAAFNPPYYNFDWPQAFNYGGQGGTGGHELTHGYDDEGVQFGPDGSLSNCDTFHCGWMDMNSTSGFTDMAQARENIADLGGQQAAYRAYRNYVASTLKGVEEPRLPGLEEYTPNQIFWITYGFSWCEKQTTDALVEQLLVDPHAPSICRTNNVMQDIPEFGRDFSCPKGSTMYPQDTDRCSVWVGN